MFRHGTDVIRLLADLYVRAPALEDGEVIIWLGRIQQRFDLDAGELNALCDEATRLGEWATAKVRQLCAPA
jgi:hypothetical protein